VSYNVYIEIRKLFAGRGGFFFVNNLRVLRTLHDYIHNNNVQSIMFRRYTLKMRKKTFLKRPHIAQYTFYLYRGNRYLKNKKRFSPSDQYIYTHTYNSKNETTQYIIITVKRRVCVILGGWLMCFRFDRMESRSRRFNDLSTKYTYIYICKCVCVWVYNIKNRIYIIYYNIRFVVRSELCCTRARLYCSFGFKL